MKKLIALLLALMMVMVSVAALATSGLDGGEGGSEGGNPPSETTGDQGDDQGDAGGATGTTTNYKKETDYKLTATAEQTIVLPKVYTVTLPSGQKAEKSLPSDTVKFEQTDSSVAYTSTVTAAPALKGITMDAIVEGGNGLPNDEGKYSYDVTIKLPSYTGVGVYSYTLTETDNKVAGVTYIGNIALKVTVVQNGDALQIAGIALRKADDATDTGANTKLDKFENTYKAGSLTVTKTVDGTMGDRSKKFPIDVVFTAPSDKKVTGTITYYAGETEKGTVAPGEEEEGWTGSKTVSLELAHGETIQFDNIPDGVTYTVIEGDAIDHLETSKQDQSNPEAYKVDGEVTSATAITAGSVTPVTITNTKDIDVDTGITLETLPYVLLMALAAMGFVALKLRKREEY